MKEVNYLNTMSTEGPDQLRADNINSCDATLLTHSENNAWAMRLFSLNLPLKPTVGVPVVGAVVNESD